MQELEPEIIQEEPLSIPFQQWEYKVVIRSPAYGQATNLEEELNLLGSEGWELAFFLANALGDRLIFKRPKMSINLDDALIQY